MFHRPVPLNRTQKIGQYPVRKGGMLLFSGESVDWKECRATLGASLT